MTFEFVDQGASELGTGTALRTCPQFLQPTTNTACDKFEGLFVIPAKAGIHRSPIKAFGDDKFELPLEFIEQRTKSKCRQVLEKS